MELSALAELFGIDFVTVTSTAAVVMLVIGFLKEFLPQLKGKTTQLISLGLCVILSIATYHADGIVIMAVSSILMFAMTVGGYKLIKKAGGK